MSEPDRYARYEQLKFDRPHPRVLRITLASPLKLNAMTPTLHRECSQIWRDVDADPTVSVAIITGSDKAFSAGGDLAHERKTCDDYELRMQAMKESRDLVYNMIACSKPIVSAVRGWAVGAGIACALLADISIAAKDAKFSDGHAKIGIAAGDHATILWPLLCGMARAKYYLLLAEPFTGEEAANMGIVSLAVDGDQLEAKSIEIATRLALQAPGATRWTKHTLNHWLRQAAPIFDASLALEFIGFAGPEGKEGMDAFLQKRTPSFPLDSNV
jgi:enoyl-CoA hydratase